MLGPDHPALANALDQLGNTLSAQGRGAEAEAAKREALALALRAFGEGHRETARLQNNLGWALYGNGAHAEAESLFRKALPALRKTQGVSAPFTRIASNGLAYALYGLRDYRAAESAARESLALWRQYPNDRSVVGALNVLGASLVAQRRFKEAEPLLLSGYEGLRDLRDAPAAHLRMAMERLVDFYVACGRPEQAVAWRNRLNGVTAAAPSAATSARR